MRYTEHSTGMELDSRQDEDEFACSECGLITLADFLEPCPEGVFPRLGAVCADCAEALRSEVERMAAE